ncbi:glycosyl transferase family 8 [Calothrix sp. NIES-4101]|nr:glycosyl transferase family 8 [Calothrix sp. NIES-4101]
MFTNVDNLNREKCFETHQKEEPIVVVCAADDKYAMPLAVMARSVIENIKSDRKITLFIIDGGIQNKNKKKILKTLGSKNSEIEFIHRPDSLVKKLEDVVKYTLTNGQAKKHLTIAAYYRLFIADLLPDNVEKAIYLDCDLVVEEDLDKLWQKNLGDNYLLAAQDIWIHSISSHNGILNYQELGINPNEKYFNSGVIFINIKKWRSEQISVKAIDYLKQNKDYIRFADQDILNALFVGEWGELDLRWNVTPGIYEYASWNESPFSENVYNNLINKPYVIHFAAATKPWNSDDALFKEYFYRYVDKTAWKGWRFTFWKKLQLKLSYKFQKLKKWLG